MSDMTQEELVGKLVKERYGRCRTVYEVRAVEDYGGRPHALLVWVTRWYVPQAQWVPLEQLRHYSVVGDVKTGRRPPSEWEEAGL